MSVSNPSAANPSGANAPTLEQPADIQQLVGLLGSLMPLLLRFQSQPLFQSPVFPSPGFQSPGFPPPGFQQISPTSLAPLHPALDQQAAINLTGDITASALRNLSVYLETYAPRHAGLASCLPIVTQAARSFAMRDYASAFNLIWQAYRVIALAQANDPQLPPLQSGDTTAAAASAPTTSIH
jgi:hypothetical protein